MRLSEIHPLPPVRSTWNLITPFILLTLNKPAPICPAISQHEIFKACTMDFRPQQRERLSLTDQIKGEE